MRGSRRNKIRPRGNPAIVRSIPAVFPQHSYPHPRIPAVPIPVHTSRLNLSVAGCTWKRLRVVTIRRHLHKSYRGADRSGPAAVCVCVSSVGANKGIELTRLQRAQLCHASSATILANRPARHALNPETIDAAATPRRRWRRPPANNITHSIACILHPILIR